jgi:nitric oxide reductase NorQ protein
MSQMNIEQYLIKKEPFYLPQGNEVNLYEVAYKKRLPVMLKGPTGCGKSRFVEHMAWKLGKPLITVACNEDMTASDLVGRYLLDVNGTRWLDGPLTVAARLGAICYLDEVVEARQDTTVVIHPLVDHRRALPLDKKGEQIETDILAQESGVAVDLAAKLVKIGITARNLKGHGLDEGISTRLLVYAATLIREGVDVKDACHMALVSPITDDTDIRSTLVHAIEQIM